MRGNPDWKSLVGEHVKVQKDGKLVRTGYVQDVMNSADVLWIEAEGSHQRALFEKAMGYIIQPMQRTIAHQP